MNQKVMVRMLAKFGHKVTVANDGREAVTIFGALDTNQRFDCILMDIQVCRNISTPFTIRGNFNMLICVDAAHEWRRGIAYDTED